MKERVKEGCKRGEQERKKRMPCADHEKRTFRREGGRSGRWVSGRRKESGREGTIGTNDGIWGGKLEAGSEGRKEAMNYVSKGGRKARRKGNQIATENTTEGYN